MGTLVIKSKTHGERIVLYDDTDEALIKSHNWVLEKAGRKFYAVTQKQVNFKRVKTSMHRLLMNLPTIEVDHIDCNGLNNHRSNLRLATRQMNNFNRDSAANNKTGYKGVIKQARTKSKYAARITFNGEIIQISGLNSAQEAAKKYNELATQHFGEFAKLNVL